MTIKKTSGARIIFFAVFSLALLVFFQEVQAATYYVSSSGNDSNSGLSDSQAWKTVGKVNAGPSGGFKPGDDVYFKCGGMWTDAALTIDWSGASESNRAFIGAYFGNGTVVDETNKSQAGAMPTFDGGLNTTAWTSSLPSNELGKGSLVTISGDYVTVKYLNIKQSGGMAIVVNGRDYATIERCQIYKCFGVGVSAGGGPNYLRVLNNDFDLVSLWRAYDEMTGAPQPRYGGCIQSATEKGNSYRGVYIAYNKITRAHGEGIDILKGGKDSVVEYNKIHSRSACMYFDRGIQNSIMRYNLVECTTYPSEGNNWKSSHACGSALGIDDEVSEWGESGNNYYVGNLAFGVQRGIPFGTVTLKGAHYYNNVIVNSVLDNVWSNPASVFSTQTSYVRNNIFLCTGDSGYCTNSNTLAQNKGSYLVWDRNLFYSGNGQAISSYSRGTGDITANPQLYKMTGWSKEQIAPGSLTGIEFSLLPASPAKDAGVNLLPISVPPVDFSQTLDLNKSNFKTGCGVNGIGAEAFKLVDQDINGVRWDIGADVYVTGDDAIAPASPSGLSVK